MVSYPASSIMLKMLKIMVSYPTSSIMLKMLKIMVSFPTSSNGVVSHFKYNVTLVVEVCQQSRVNYLFE